jgi:hypothetical protein
MILTCPSGLSGEVRSLKVKELQRLADPSLARGGRNIDVMLGVFTSITDPGPYKWEPGSQPVWDQVLTGDRFSALIDVRCATWGPSYEFTTRCEECHEPCEWELDLRDLPRRKFPTETLDALKDGGANRFECEGPSGELVRFKLLYGADEKAIEKYRRDHGGLYGLGDALERKILSVEGIDSGALRAWIANLDAKPAHDLALRMDLADGGVDTDIEIVCSKCQWQQWVSLPFGKAFFVPATKRRAPTTEKDPTTPTTPAANAVAPTLSQAGYTSEYSARRTG